MTRVLALVALIVSAMLALPTAAQAQNWDATFAATQGGHRLGNPRAAVRLTAYVSYTCPHCYDFEMAADAPLRLNYIQPGRVSLEVRSMIRNPVDLAATLAVECGAEDKFWANHRAMFRAQPRWSSVMALASRSQQARWSSGTFGERMRAIASDLDFYGVLEPRGYTRAQLDQCLTDEANARAISTRSQADWEASGISGTPGFAINGTTAANVHTWPALRARLDAALGQ